MEGRRTIHLRCVHVRVCRDQFLDGGTVVLSGGVGDIGSSSGVRKNTNDKKRGGQAHQIEAGSVSSTSLPVLSAKESIRTPTRSSSVRCRLAIGVISRYFTYRPPVLDFPPATTIGRLV